MTRITVPVPPADVVLRILHALAEHHLLDDVETIQLEPPVVIMRNSHTGRSAKIFGVPTYVDGRNISAYLWGRRSRHDLVAVKALSPEATREAE